MPRRNVGEFHMLTWMGKAENHIRVGKDKSYDYTTIQGAVDAVVAAGDSASDNPYVISIDRGVYLEAVQIADVTDLGIVADPGAILIRDNTISSSPGGTLTIGNAAFDTTERIRIEGLHVVNQRDGEAEGGPPEGAIFVGEEDRYNTSGNGWDEVIIRNCVIEGVHDALQMFGQNRDGGSNTTPPSRLWLINNVLKCAHDAVTTKGRIRGFSNANQVYCNASGLSPYLTSVDDWKTTGYHHNVGAGGGDDEGVGFWKSTADIFYLEGGDYNDGLVMAGLYIYAGGKAGTVAMRHRFVSPVIHVERDVNLAIENTLAGIQLDGQNLMSDDDWLVFQDVNIFVHQKSTGASAPDIAAGVVNQAITNAALIKVIGGHIQVINDKAASSAFSLYASTSVATIEHGSVYSEQATDDNGGTGTITRLSEL